jgi:hypothetical protein
MFGWRMRFVFLLAVYFAGFATAIYCLAPLPQDQVAMSPNCDKGFTYSAFKSDEFAKSFNAGMHKCLDYAKDAAVRAGNFIKQKYDEKQNSHSRTVASKTDS